MLPSFTLANFVTRWGNDQPVFRQYLQLDYATIYNWQFHKWLHLQQNVNCRKIRPRNSPDENTQNTKRQHNLVLLKVRNEQDHKPVHPPHTVTAYLYISLLINLSLLLCL